MKQFSDIVWKLSSTTDEPDIRGFIFPEIITLVNADIALSCVWSSETRKFVHPYDYNMDKSNLDRYDSWFQFHDPHTSKLRMLKRTARVEEVMPYGELRKTEFYNDFLKPDGFHHGINLFLFDGDRDLGDFRLWRKKGSPEFEDEDLFLLAALEPYLKLAMVRNSGMGEQLTLREREVALLIARGCRDRDIASALGISFSTVRTHVNRAMEKKGCANRAELAVAASKFAKH